MKYISEELIKALMKNNRLMQGNCEYELWKMTTDKYVSSMPGIDIVRCKECRWYDTPHILHKDGTRTDVNEGSPWVTVDVGINCGGQCIHHVDLKTYCVNHDRENPDDNERIVIFRSPDDFCSYGEREGE